MSPLRVVLLIPTLDRSGAEKQFTLLATGLPREEFDVHVICLTRGGPYEEQLAEAGIPVTILGKRGKADPFCLLKLRKLLRKLAPDVLHTWLFAANAYGRLAIGRKNRPRVVVSERCVDSWKAGWQLWLDRRLASKTDVLVGNSESVRQFYHEVGIPAEKLRVIPNGVALPERPSSMELAERRQRLLAECNWPDDAWIVGSIGRLAPQKRVGDLIFAVETLRQIRPNLRLLIVGDGPERARLETFAQAVHVSSHVHFAGHRGDVADIQPLLQAVCLPSDFEGQSNSLMESMAVGCPCIASDIPPNRELIVHGESGLLVPPGDMVGLMQQMRVLMDDPELASRLGAAARQRMRDHFAIPDMVNRFAALYRELRSL